MLINDLPMIVPLSAPIYAKPVLIADRILTSYFVNKTYHDKNELNVTAQLRSKFLNEYYTF